MERIKNELNQTIQRKEKELSSLAAKIEDEQTLGGKYSKQIKVKDLIRNCFEIDSIRFFSILTGAPVSP